MEDILTILLSLVVLYLGCGVCSFLELLLERDVRQANFAGVGPLGFLRALGFLAFALVLAWPLVLMDRIRIPGLPTGEQVRTAQAVPEPVEVETEEPPVDRTRRAANRRKRKAKKKRRRK